ncbi:hypothetical protein [Bacillus sp. FJAT-27245]|uniref:hypothetical protein n=1 Tax=Bacillus sp. FJAT-27245 TaxID=1684144 RepID=UPI0006A788BB|nr:hypothetical protein [Bacillus sp. FJAT-27245]
MKNKWIYFERVKFMSNLYSKTKCSIHLKRKSQFANKLRKFKIYLNNKYVGVIRDEEEIILPVEQGKNQNYLKVDWNKSEIYEFDINAGEIIHLLCGSPFKGMKLLIPIIPLFLDKQLFIKQVSSS